MKVSVTKEAVLLSEQSVISQGDYAVNECTFDLPGCFEGLNVTAVFNNIPVPVTEGKCIVPSLKKGNGVLGVYAYKKSDDENTVELMYSPKPCMFWVGEGSYCEDISVENIPGISEFEEYCNNLSIYYEANLKAFSEIADVLNKQLDVITDMIPGGNLFNKDSDEITREAYFSDNAGNIVTDDNSAKYKYITHYIPVENGKTYSAYWDARDFGDTARVYLYDSNFNYISTLYPVAHEAGQLETSITFTVNESNAVYIRFNGWLSLIDKCMVVEGGSYPEEYRIYGDDVYILKADLSYNPESENPQTGIAVAEAIEEAMAPFENVVEAVESGSNLFNKNAPGILLYNYEMPTTGEVRTSELSFISDFIKVNVGGVYSTVANKSLFGSDNCKCIPLYNSKKEYIGYAMGELISEEYEDATYVPITFTVQDDNAVYIRLSQRISNKERLMLVGGTEYPTEYKEYGIFLNEDVKIPQLKEYMKEENAAEISKQLDDITDLTPGGNLFNKKSDEIIKNAYFGTPTGGITTDDAFAKYRYITHYIPVENGKTYTASWDASSYGNTARVFLYDIDFNYISTLYPTAHEAGAAKTSITFTVNKTNAMYIRLHHITSQIDDYMVVEGDSYPEEYLQYGEDTYSVDASKVDSPLKGKIISFNGDSICYGAGCTGGYGKIIALRCGMEYENIGVSGGTVMYSGEDRHCISRTVVNMREDADYIILEGGVNDLFSDRPLGAMSEGYNATLDDTTFYGAFENMLKQALIRFPGKKIGYIAVHKMTDYFSSEVTENSAYYAALECCKKWGVPVCDLNISCPPFMKLKANDETAFLADLYTADTDGSGSGDGWHPNEEGYLKYYCDPIEKWLLTL